jgi:hypothetical protein
MHNGWINRVQARQLTEVAAIPSVPRVVKGQKVTARICNYPVKYLTASACASAIACIHSTSRGYGSKQ